MAEKCNWSCRTFGTTAAPGSLPGPFLVPVIKEKIVSLSTGIPVCSLADTGTSASLPRAVLYCSGVTADVISIVMKNSTH